LAAAARGMKHHLSLMETPKEAPLTAQQMVGQGFSDLLRDHTDYIRNNTDKILEHVN
jgi:hypothetical protein